jgi:hypothetical protein
MDPCRVFGKYGIPHISKLTHVVLRDRSTQKILLLAYNLYGLNIIIINVLFF